VTRFLITRDLSDGTYGQLGHSSFGSEILPRKILEFGSVIVQVGCGRSHTLCLTDKNKLYSFGLAASGQLGIGNCANKNSPMLVGSKSIYSSRICSHYFIVMLQLFQLSQDSIRSIHCGGDQSFILVSKLPEPSNTEYLHQPLDYRRFIPRSQIHRITDDLLEQMCSAVEPVDQDIMTSTETIFASPAAWNCSFLLPDDRHIPATWRNIGVDLLKVISLSYSCLLIAI